MVFKVGHLFGKRYKKGNVPWMKGKKHTEESNEKNRQAHLGKPSWNKGVKSGNHGNGFKEENIPWNKNKKGLQKNHNMSGLELGRGWNRGIKFEGGVGYGNWQGGITPLTKRIRGSFKYRQWRSDIFERDNYICQDCGERGGKIHVHHIKSFSKILFENKIEFYKQAMYCEEFWNINNGITLCLSYHKKTDSYKNIKNGVD